MDKGHKLTDKELAALEKRIEKVYREAHKGIGAIIDEYFAKFKTRDEEQKALLNEEKITKQEYAAWRLTQMGRGERYQALRDKVAERMNAANNVAIAYVNDTTPSIYALNRNFTAYTIEQATGSVGFDFWDEATIRKLLVEQPNLMPNYPKKRAIKRGIDLAWSKKSISSAVTSGILQGSSVEKIASFVQSHVTDMNRTSAVRAARTAVTAAQNAGRLDTYIAAKEMGIELKKEWVATLDGRTRHEHSILDGQVVGIDEEFTVDGYKLRFPGDPLGAPHLIYNCRCTMVAAVKDMDTSGAKRRARDAETGKWEEARGMTYAQWAAGKKAENVYVWDTYIKKSKNISTDTRQWETYKGILGNKIPNTVEEFQDLKYNEHDKWDALKTLKRQTVFVKSAECVTTPRKFAGYFLKAGAKHAQDFFDVGYSSENPMQLRYDIASQFDITKATDFSNGSDGKERFRIYMNLGVSKKKRFRTAWIIDDLDDKPRIVTAFREDRGDD